MKSLLALHLLALLLINLATLNLVGQTTASAMETMLKTTTSQPPSLRAPHRSAVPPTRVMSTQRRAITKTQTTATPLTSTVTSLTASAARRQKPPIARSSTVKRLADVDSVKNLKSYPNSTRPLRSIASSTRNSGARQNRSFQSASSSSLASVAAANAHSNGNSLTAAAVKNNNEQKHERVDRRYHLRTNQRVSNESATSLNNSSSAIASSAERRHHSPKVLEARRQQRQSKEPSMPSVIFDTKPSNSIRANEHEMQTEIQSHPQHNATKPRQTAKTPRMIHRLVAGHIQNAEGHSTYQVSAVTSNSSVSSSTTTLKPTSPTKASAKYSATISEQPTPVKLKSILDLPVRTAFERDEDDEALLDDAGDFDNWDNGILRLSAGSGKENSKPKKTKHNKADDSKKTLSDQVRDGKYGLIEKELFSRAPKRPGILSYSPNKEVPIDNEHNFGGLQEEDIWLAEDHLLVIKGGSLNEEKPHEEPWPAIDDYDAPGRQIKIPPNPKVPPPFPVQLEENGPVQFIGNNKFTLVYPVANESIPIYTVGPETDHTFTETDSGNEKNTLTRPGTSQNTASGEPPHYVYPAPYPPWLYNKQTFVNPLLSSARPITFPGLGPFPFGRNGSLDNSNGTDYFDEDDPNLYYPPAYSFVYKNNYTNAVPPGPLVPGIVLPPPANQFSRLEKPDKAIVTTPQTAPQRKRITTTTPTTSTSTTTRTTTTTTTTTELPFRPVFTKILEYTPKIINITPATPTVSTSLPTKSYVKIPVTPPTAPTTPPTPLPISIHSIEPIPVPVAVPVPISIYPSRKYPTSKPHADTLSKSNPIYYEYFESKRQPIKSNVLNDFLASTVEPPPSPKPIKLHASSKRPFKTQQHRNYLQPLPPTQRKPFKENVVHITPKPEIRYKTPNFKQRPLENFEREVDALRQTLRYYQNQQLRDNSIPRTPKVKSIYEFTFDATKNLQRPENDFRPPLEYDEEPFKPMVTYSPPINDENSFTPMAYDKADETDSENLSPASKQLPQQANYQSTTTLLPVPSDAEFQIQQPQQRRLKKQRLSAKYLQEPFIETEFEPQQPQPDPYKNQRPWIAIGKAQVDNYDAPPPQTPVDTTQRYEQYQYGSPKNRAYTGYFYRPPPRPLPPNRQNNRFYDEPFRQVINYQRSRPNINYQPPPQQQQQQQQNYWSLENDTYVNYAPNRPPINPDAEFIEPYNTFPINTYVGQGRYQTSPALSHQSQYYAPPSRPIPLHRDILVNYRQPLPPINPDSEFITHPQVVRNQGNQIYRSDSYHRFPPPPPPEPPLIENGDEQRNVYYASPKYRRANNNNNGNGNSNGNGNANKRESRSSSSSSSSDKNNSK